MDRALCTSVVQLPILDSSSESGSDAPSTLTDTLSEAGSIADPASDPNSIPDARIRPSALRSRLPLLPNEARAADSATAEPQRCCCFIHPSHQSELGIELLLSALLDLDREFVRVRERIAPSSYPRTVPRCPVDATWHLLHLMRRVQQQLASLDPGEE